MTITRRQLAFGAHRLTAEGPAVGAAPFILAGPRLYAIGYGSGEIGPIGTEHVVGEMGGIWAHPLKVADGFTLALRSPDGAPLALDNGLFSEGPAEIAWTWSTSALRLLRRDRVLPGEPAYASMVTLANESGATATGTLEVTAHLKFLGCWFGGQPATGGTYAMSDALVLGHDQGLPAWGIALGAAVPPDNTQVAPNERGATVTLEYRFTLEPGASRVWLLLLCVSQDGGEAAATARWRERIDGAATHFADDDDPLAGLPRLASEDGDLARDVALAQANLRLLEADNRELGLYFLAGLPEYPQLFGCDTAYSIPGAVAAGFTITTRSALMSLARYATQACGRVPHEITTNGRIFHPGNIQETPQLTIAVWDYLRWTGDLDLVRQLFPTLREGLTAYLPAIGGPDPRYPIGDGMVERLGMGSRKLDSACYHIAGLRVLARLAAALDEPDAAGYVTTADAVQRDFERDWWLEEAGLYADSMHTDGRLQLDGHWTQVLPVQLGLASPERAEQVLARIEETFVNQWGLVHTRGREELVWTLPTGLLALAAFKMGRAERGLALARSIAQTAHHGTLGTFKELIPEGLCFVQLWSAALYLQVIFEGLLGLQPDALAHALTITPALPPDHPPVSVRGLRVGAHQVTLTITPGILELDHLAGPQALTVHYSGTSDMVEPGASLRRTLSERR
jgi:hypothetical protein